MQKPVTVGSQNQGFVLVSNRIHTMRGMDGVFVWRLLGGGAAEDRFSEGFADRAEAEAWIGAAWEDLAAEGIEEVELLERAADGADARPIYRMSLAEG